MSDEIKKGLLGIVVDETTISHVVPELSALTYRGYKVQDLCDKCDFEEVAYLVLYGELPSKNQLKKFIKEERIDKIDLIKIDTEGFEFNVLTGLGIEIRKVKFILFEHHYDNMIIKNYKFGDIHKLLQDNEFQRIFKIKMPFRKSFDYIYENKR